MPKNLCLSAIILFFGVITNHAFTQVDDVKRIVKELCSPKFHGRGYIKGGDSLAAEFIKNEFIAAGLRPVTTDYFQHFSFAVNTFPNKANFYKNGIQLNTGVDIISDAQSPSYHDTLQYKIVHSREIYDADLILRKIQMAINNDGFNSIAINIDHLKGDTLKMVKSFAHQIAQFVPVILIHSNKFIWSVGRKQLAFPIFEMTPEIADETPIIVELDAIMKEQHNTKNVLGYLPAAKKTNKTIVICAHYDHLGGLGKDVYFPGANDNASGTAMIISLAKYFKQNPPKYNILFIAFAGEEAGILGSKFYVENPVLPLEDIQFVINLDILGSGEEGITVVNGSVHPKHFEVLEQINKEKNLLSQVKQRGYSANSDHYWFADREIKAFFIYTMGPNKQYHDPMDTYENLSFAEVNDLQQLLVDFITRITTQKIKEEKKK